MAYFHAFLQFSADVIDEEDIRGMVTKYPFI